MREGIIHWSLPCWLAGQWICEFSPEMWTQLVPIKSTFSTVYKCLKPAFQFFWGVGLPRLGLGEGFSLPSFSRGSLFLQASSRVQAPISSGKKHLRLMGGLIEMSLSWNVLWGTPIANFSGQGFLLCLAMRAWESRVFPVLLWYDLTVSLCQMLAIVIVWSRQWWRHSPTTSYHRSHGEPAVQPISSRNPGTLGS